MHTLWLTLLLTLEPARPSLATHVDPCLELDVDALRESIELRLGPGLEHRGGAAGQADDTQLLLDCASEREAELTLIDPINGVTMTRIVELPPPERRVERLAEHATTLLRSAWLGVALERPSDRRRTRAERVAARVARRPSAPWELGDGFVIRSFFDPGGPTVMLGEQVEVVHRPLRHLAWKADGELAFWRVPVESDATTDKVATWSISAAPALLGWAEIPGRGRRGAGTVALYGGPGLRAGGVYMNSSSFGDSGGFRSFVGPLLMARASVSLGRFVGLALNVEAGWLVHGPDRPNGIPLSLRGPWANGVVVIVSRF
ncbi:MAG TPA: hypothetical protein VK034_11040 [Enhygromyxa sp.]|nr:hypothetical protein [Enhygromyxa sp.]